MTEQLKEIMKAGSLDGILITDPFSLRYYTGFRGGEGIALSAAGEHILYVDSRYTEAASQEVKEAESGFAVIEYNHANPLYELLRDAKAPEFKAISKIVK